jgi:hypothetical protein
MVSAGDTSPAVANSLTVPWRETVKSSAGSELLDWNMMIGWPTFTPWRHTSTTKPGLVMRTSLNFLLKSAGYRTTACPG